MWVCKTCQSEVEDTFFACWNCSTPKPGTGEAIEWLTSESGLLLTIPQTLVGSWDGLNPSAPGVPSRDLERAFAVEGWITAVEVGSGQALVLSGCPTDAAFYKLDGKLCILRWLCGNSVQDILKLADSHASSTISESSITFVHPGGRLLLISAGDCGTELNYNPPAAELNAGHYLVRSFILKQPGTEVLLHCFNQTPHAQTFP